MADSDITMFDPMGRATSFQHARWRAKGGLVPLQAETVLLDDKRLATQSYRDAWTYGFPTRSPFPLSAVATKDGKFTDDMLNVWL